MPTSVAAGLVVAAIFASRYLIDPPGWVLVAGLILWILAMARMLYGIFQKHRMLGATAETWMLGLGFVGLSAAHVPSIVVGEVPLWWAFSFLAIAAIMLALFVYGSIHDRRAGVDWTCWLCGEKVTEVRYVVHKNRQVRHAKCFAEEEERES